MSNCKYNFGLITTTPINVGEEIQSIAAMRFLPKIDVYIHREHISKYYSQNNKLTKLIANAWWMWNPKSFPPSKDILPLLISMYFRVEIRKNFLTTKVRNYLTKNGPIGCRDKNTCEWLKKNNIPAYFSGCLTLTLKKNENIKKQNYILCVDIAEEIVNEIKKRTHLPVYSIGVDLCPIYSAKERIEISKIYLRLYQEAHCVVSNRLHVVLPCLALETPVLKLDSTKKERNIKERYSGYENFAHTCTVDEFLNNPKFYNFNTPPENPQNHIELANKLTETCKNFTGYDSEESQIYEDEHPIFELLKYTTYSTQKMRLASHRTNKRRLFKTLIRKIFGQKEPYDFEKVSIEYKDFK